MSPDSASGFTGKAYTEYTTAVQEQMELFNGREHIDYLYKFDVGSPYFLAGNFSKGDVTYLNKTYKDVSLTYDVVKDEVAILHFNILKRLIPDKLKLDAFTINGHHFIKLSPGITNYKSLPEGYYDLLYNDKISLLAKRTKSIRDIIPEIRVYSKDIFYISKNNTFYEVNANKSFLKHFTDKKKQITQFMRQNDISFTGNKEQAMIKIITHYNSLVKQDED